MKNAAELKEHVYDIVGALHSVHAELGPGVNEYCYQEAFAMELSDRGIPFEREKAFHPYYKGRQMDAEYRIGVIAHNLSELDLNFTVCDGSCRGSRC